MKWSTIFLSGFLVIANTCAYAEDAINLNFSTEYDSTGSTVFVGKVANVFTPRNALALEFNAGSNTLRANATYAFKLGQNNYFKITDDFLYQKRHFDFDKIIGKSNVKLYQNAIGAAYHYDLNGKFLNGLETSFYYSHAPSKDVGFKPVRGSFEKVGDGQYEWVNHKARIAGSNVTHSEISVDVSPWSNNLIRLGATYDTVNFDQKWEKSKRDSAFGWHVETEQVVFSWLKTRGNYTFLNLEKNYGFGFSMMLPSTENIKLELLGDFSKIDNTMINKNYWLSTASLKATIWDSKPRKSYQADQDSLTMREWVSKPAVRMHDVIVKPESMYEKSFIANIYQDMPSLEEISLLDADSRHVKHNRMLWVVSKNIGSLPEEGLSKVQFSNAKYYPANGKLYAEYDVGNGSKNGQTLGFEYKSAYPVKTVIGNNWQTTDGGKTYVCQSSDSQVRMSPSGCKFEITLINEGTILK